MNHKFSCVVVLNTIGEVVSDGLHGTSIMNQPVKVYPIVTLIHTPADKLSPEDEQDLKALIAKQIIDWASRSTSVTKNDGTPVERHEIPKVPDGEVN